MSSPLVRTLLTDPARTHAYAKWSGAHWRLVSLVELGVPTWQPEALAVCDLVLSHWAKPQRSAQVPMVNGRARRCASQEGNAVAAACRIGLADDPRVTVLVEHLLESQWPDGMSTAPRPVRPWWRTPSATGSGVEAVDWADVAHQMVTLDALRVGGSEPG